MKNPYYPYSIDNRHQLEIDYENADYKYNYDEYKYLKLIFWLAIVIGIIGCVLAIIYGSDIIQTISASILGGLLSLFVWLIAQGESQSYVQLSDLRKQWCDDHLYVRGHAGRPYRSLVSGW